MAGLETLSGVSKESEFLYIVTGDVTVGAGIDDIFNATILVNGGSLTFGNGCNTRIVKSTIIERAGAYNYGTDNFNGSARCRIKGDITCAPVLEGTKWIKELDNVFARSDFDIGGTAKPTFKRAEDGTPCWIIIRGSHQQFNHFASPNIVIAGLIIDDQCTGADLEFRIPPSINDLKIINNDGNSSDRHVVLLTSFWASGATYDLEKINARNVALYQADATKTLRLIDPVGDLRKGEFNNGVLEIWRTYQCALLDIETNTAVVGSLSITRGNEYIHDSSANNFNVPLFQDRQAHNTYNVTTNNSYRRAICAWGYQYDVRTFDVVWNASTPEGFNENTIVVRKDNYIQSTFADVSNRNNSNSLAQVYEAIKHFELSRADKQNRGSALVEGAGETIKFNTASVRFLSGSNANRLALNNNALTVYASAFAISAFKAIDGVIEIQSQADLDRLSGLRIVGNGQLRINMTSGSEVSLNNITFDTASTHIQSTNTLTVLNTGTSNATTASANVTLKNPVTATFDAVFDGTPPTDYEWRLYTNSASVNLIGDTELAGVENETSQQFSYTYNYTQDIEAQIQIIADGYEEFTQKITLPNNATQFTLNLTTETEI